MPDAIVRPVDPRAVPAAHSMDTAWFGVDADGNLALFDTGEAGAFPEDAAGFGEHARPVGGHPDGFDAIAAAVGLPEDFWEEEAPLPVFRYAHDDDNWTAGRYVRTAAPPRPARIEEVPAELRDGIVKLPVRFAAAQPVQPVEHVPCTAWGATWLSADGTTVRPFPDREDEAADEVAEVESMGLRYDPDPGPARTRGVNAPEAPPPDPVTRAALPSRGSGLGVPVAEATPDQLRAALGLPPRAPSAPSAPEAPAPPKKPWWKLW